LVARLNNRFDGRMIDVPIVERAKLLLEREEAIAAREAKKQALVDRL